MKIATWNVNGIRARQEQLSAWLAAEMPDVVCLQEIKATREQIPESICNPDGYTCHWHGYKGYSGVALLVRKDRFGEPIFGHPGFDLESRIVVAQLGRAVLASVYVPNGNKDFPAKMTFLRELTGWARSLKAEGRDLVLCGDLNVARTDRDVHPKERKPVTGQLPEEREMLEMLIGAGLIDVGRATAPDADDLFTWWAPWRNLRQRNIGWRLDYVLASTRLVDAETRCQTYREVGTSDHGPVIAWLKDPEA